jgi:hypothetical protein
MKNDSELKSKGKKKRPTVLLTFTTIYAILYAALILSYLFFEDSTSLEMTTEGIIVTLAFVIFYAGYYYSWKNELIAGIIFIFWWAIMWYLALFVAETDRGAGVVMGIPVIIFGILFIVNWYRKRSGEKRRVKEV